MQPRALDGEQQDLDGGVEREPVIERALRDHCKVMCIKWMLVYLLGYSVNSKNEALFCCALSFCGCWQASLISYCNFIFIKKCCSSWNVWNIFRTLRAKPTLWLQFWQSAKSLTCLRIITRQIRKSNKLQMKKRGPKLKAFVLVGVDETCAVCNAPEEWR